MALVAARSGEMIFRYDLETAMTIKYRILGAPGRDNALFVQVDTGQAISRLLFDCGSGCLNGLPVSEVQAVDQLLFSHLHMDHVAGFDIFFRLTFDRESKINRLWGPPETGRIMHHRFRGFIWNLHDDRPATWLVSDIHPDNIDTARFELKEAFEHRHQEARRPLPDHLILSGDGYTVQALAMNHLIPSMAYLVRETPHLNIERQSLAALNLTPGSWLQTVKEADDPGTRLTIDGRQFTLAELQAALLVESEGDSIAYLTDFRLDEPAQRRLVPLLKGCRTLVCESCYRHSEIDLARRYCHLTAVQAAELAREAGVNKLILIHLSGRYTTAEWLALLDEARGIFVNTTFPDHWNLNHD